MSFAASVMLALFFVWMIIGMPIGREEKVAFLRDGEGSRAVGNVPWHAIIGRGLEIRSPWIGPCRK